MSSSVEPRGVPWVERQLYEPQNCPPSKSASCCRLFRRRLSAELRKMPGLSLLSPYIVLYSVCAQKHPETHLHVGQLLQTIQAQAVR